MLRVIELTFFVIIVISSANAASVIFNYSDKGETNGILGITGITQESSWRCRNSSSTLCECPTKIYQGRIAKVDYRKGEALAEGFVLETSKGAQYFNLGTDWDNDLGTAASSWVPRLIRPKENVLVVAELCGASGSNVIARDIFSARMLDKSRK